MGALSGADKEVYRRFFASYENEKIEINGDVAPNLEEEKDFYIDIPMTQAYLDRKKAEEIYGT